MIICFVGAMMASLNLKAQTPENALTPEEVAERMSAELDKADSLGMSFDFGFDIAYSFELSTPEIV